MSYPFPFSERTGEQLAKHKGILDESGRVADDLALGVQKHLLRTNHSGVCDSSEFMNLTRGDHLGRIMVNFVGGSSTSVDRALSPTCYIVPLGQVKSRTAALNVDLHVSESFLCAKASRSSLMSRAETTRAAS